MAQDEDEAGRPPDAPGSFVVAAENGHHGVNEKLVERYDRVGDGLYTFVACVIALAVSGLAAFLTKQPLLFPL